MAPPTTINTGKRMNAQSSVSNVHSNSSSSQGVSVGHRVHVQQLDYDGQVRIGLPVQQPQQQRGVNPHVPRCAQLFDTTSLSTSQDGDDSVHEQYPHAR
jgi:hypothetical protein